MPETDDRFLDASYDDMQLDFYAAYYSRLKAGGQTEMYEDDNWNLDDILQKLEDEAEADAPPPDDWETVEDWDARDES